MSREEYVRKLLEAYRTWGVRCLQKLQGMFAFGIWDTVERRLFVARDRLGDRCRT